MSLVAKTSAGENTSPIPRIPPPEATGCEEWGSGVVFILASKLLHPWLKAMGVELSTVALVLKQELVRIDQYPTQVFEARC